MKGDRNNSVSFTCSSSVNIKIFHNAQLQLNFCKLASIVKLRYRNDLSEYGLQLVFQIA